MTPEAREAKRAESAEKLEAAVRGVLESEGFAQWAKTRRAFRQYSWANQLMIAMQAPDASRVCGYRKWQELGRQVIKGESAIRIWAPLIRKSETDPDKRECYGFRLVPVFDVAQTEGEELPPFPGLELESSDYVDALGRLEVFGREELGYSIEYVGDGELGGAHGVCNLESKSIRIVSASVDAQLKVLAHELAHAHGIDYTDYPRDRAEVIVEAAASLALQTVGLDTSSYSLAYIAAWAGDDGEGLEALKSDLGDIHKIATALEDAMIGPAGDE